LSSSEKRLYFVNQIQETGISYNMPIALRIEGKIDKHLIEEAVLTMIRRHENLRASFHLNQGEPVKRIGEPGEVTLIVAYSDSPGKKAVESLDPFIRPFDLTSSPLMRVGMIKESEDKQLLLFDIHHIISDAQSLEIIQKEFLDNYKGLPNRELAIQYTDFTCWQQNQEQAETLSEQEQYWKQVYFDSPDIPRVNLPEDFPRPREFTFEGDHLRIQLENHEVKILNELKRQHQVTLFMVMMAIMNILVSKYSAQDDVIIGTAVTGRTKEELAPIIGMCVNSLAIRNQPKPEKKFLEFIKEVRDNCLLAFENQDIQLENLIEKLKLRRDLSRNPIFDVSLVVQRNNELEAVIEGLTISPMKHRSQASKFDLTLFVQEREVEIHIELEYYTRIFERETIRCMIHHFRKILRQLNQESGITLQEIELITIEEKNQLLFEFNNVMVNYYKKETLDQLIEIQSIRSADHISVVCTHEHITYRELDHRAHRLSIELIKRRIQPNTIVGIMADPTIEMAKGIIGILKTGAAYLPVEPGLPRERINYELEDSAATIMVTHGEYINHSWHMKETIDINCDFGKEDESIHLKNICEPDDYAYVIYTSGTTGRPKGVLVQHRNIVNALLYRKNRYLMDASYTCLQLFSYAFDGFLLSFFTPLLSGGRVVFLGKDGLKQLHKIQKTISQEKINHFICVPTLLDFLLENIRSESLKTLRIVTLGGEKISPETLKKAKEKIKEIQIVNEYGVTEATIISTLNWHQEIETEGNRIGQPIGNTRIYIVDKTGRLQPLGIAGEMCISGTGVVQGYMNKPELTALQFYQARFLKNERLYRTGDSARWRSDGSIDYLGRIDRQVKIRGYRIELGEIEKQLQALKGIKEAVVIEKRKGDPSPWLCAIIVPDNARAEILCRGQARLALKKIPQKNKIFMHSNIGDITKETIRRSLTQQLPEFMIPTQIVFADTIPFTHLGKIDYKTLEERSSEEESAIPRHHPSETPLQEKLVQIWREVFAQEIGIDDNFFDLGGQSLKAIRLTSSIWKELEINVPIEEIFRKQTIRGLSGYMTEKKKSHYHTIHPAPRREYYPQSSSQERFYLLHQLEQIGTHYNMPSVHEAKGELEKDKIEMAIRHMVQRHESLRTSFFQLDGKLLQKIHPYQVGGSVTEYKEIPENTDIKRIITEFIKPFDLSEIPLFRVKLIKTGPARHLLLFDIHHIISDGASIANFIKEVTTLYEGKQLPALGIQYKDFSWWQKELLTSGQLKEQEQYWKAQLKGTLPILHMPLDYPRPSLQSFKGARIGFQIKKPIKLKINHLIRKTGTTMYILLLALFNVLLSKYTSQEDIIIGSPHAGRTHPDVENLIGLFMETIALRNFPSRDQCFLDFLQQVKIQCLNAYENQAYTFGEILKKLNEGGAKKRDLSRNPIFDVMFILQDIEMEPLEFEGLKFQPIRFETSVSKVDFTLEACETEEKILLGLEYCTSIFKQQTMHRLARHFITITENILENPEKVLSEVELMNEEERRCVLEEFNNTENPYPQDNSIPGMFGAQVETTPHRIALCGLSLHHQQQGKEVQHTYKKLNEKAQNLSQLLKKEGIRSNEIVAILAERTVESITGIIAILLAGAAYLPIDTGYPLKRVQYILKDTHLQYALIQEKMRHYLIDSVKAIELENIYPNPGIQTQEHIQNTNLAYIIYTSGTTGKPRGVMVSHLNLLNYILSFDHQFHIGPQHRIAQQASFSFDASIEEIFPFLLKGGRIEILQKTTLQDPYHFQGFLRERKINIIDCSPHVLSQVNEMDTCKNIKTFISGGDVLLPHQIQKLLAKGEVYNTYGPTEATVCATYFKCQGNSAFPIPIGKPISNYRVYIMDLELNPLPVGIAGQLCISGKGVTKGYLNNPSVTQKKYVKIPGKLGTQSGDLYLTGDLARWKSDDEPNIEFLGRNDRQVNIRGYRVELGEIERVLREQKGIRESVTIFKENRKGDSQICVYYVQDEGHPVTSSDLRKRLFTELPGYMVPTIIQRQEEIPKGPSGKPDMEALAAIGIPINRDKEFQAPVNQVEKKLAKLWGEILEIEPGLIGSHHHFFEMGGQSILAMKLITRIYEELQVRVPLVEVFQKGILREMAEFIIKSLEKDNKEPIEKEDKINSTGFYQPFSLERAPLVRTKLVKLPKGNHLLWWEMHHIIADGISLQVIAEDLIGLYTGIERPPKPIHYRDYARWQQDYFIKTEQYKNQENYWMMDLKRLGPLVPLPWDFPKTVDSIKNPSSAETCIQHLGSLLAQTANHMATQQGVTLFMLFLAIFQVQLYRYKTHDQEEIRVGTPVSGRNRLQMEGMVGPLINTLVLRSKPETGMTFMEFLRQIRTNTLEALENQDYQYEMLVEKLGLSGQQGDALFSTLFSLQRMKERHQEQKEESLRIHPFDLKNKGVLFDIVLAVQVMDNDIKLVFTYDPRLFKTETITLMATQLTHLTEMILEDPQKSISHILSPGVQPGGCPGTQGEHEMQAESLRYSETLYRGKSCICPKSLEKVLYEFNETHMEYPREKLIHNFFEDQAKRTPDSGALIFEEEQWTYQELENNSDYVANYLNGKGIRENTIVGLLVYRSPRMMAGILGILKSGGCYLPINPEYPQSRIHYFISDTSTACLMAEKPMAGRIKISGVEVIQLDTLLEKGNPKGRTHPPLTPPKDDLQLAYIIYTSGTAGKQKGVMVEHRALVNRLSWMQNQYPLKSQDVVLQKTTITFDVSVMEIFSWFMGGAKICLLNSRDEKDIKRIQEKIERYKISAISFTPTIFKIFLSSLKKGEAHRITTLRWIFCAGEQLPLQLVQEFRQYQAQIPTKLENLYGPTEAAVYASYFSCKVEDNSTVIPIGKPLGNTRLHILDNEGKPVPSGDSGELYISGQGLGVGYINQPALTEKKFPLEIEGKENTKRTTCSRMYRTGDYARYLPEGNIEFLGRKDLQVKIKGVRIELGEIETQLLLHPGIQEVMVIDQDDPNGVKHLAAYIILKENITVTVKELRTHLGKELPQYMIPQAFVQLKEFPLNTTGKRDLKRLRELKSRTNIQTSKKYIPPTGEKELQLVEIWEKVLRNTGIGVQDNFFELGGDSLTANVILGKVNFHFSTSLGIQDIFDCPTILQIAELIGKSVISEQVKMAPVEKQEYYTASSQQKRFYILDQLRQEDLGYHLSFAFIIEGDLDKERLKNTIKKILQQHEALRTCFIVKNGNIFQKVEELPETGGGFETETWESEDEDVQGIIKGIVKLKRVSENKQDHSFSMEKLERIERKREEI
jgi:fengycin family lipopeptide synthetase D